MQTHQGINFSAKYELFSEQWSPKVIAELNDYQFKLSKVEGDFIWHTHEDTDEAFIVLEGELRIDFRDGHVLLQAGEMYVVPKSVQHKPSAQKETRLLLIEPRGVANTGSEGGERTSVNDARI
jgi:mannose-6-phosphate isomerase-like protein (cupin superfamily)